MQTGVTSCRAYCVASVEARWGLRQSSPFLQSVFDGYCRLHETHFQYAGQGADGRVLDRCHSRHDLRLDDKVSNQERRAEILALEAICT